MSRSALGVATALILVTVGCFGTPEPLPSPSPGGSLPSELNALCPGDVGAGTDGTSAAGRVASLAGRPPENPGWSAQAGGSGEESAGAGWRLCLADGSRLQGAGLCHWSADRTRVLWMIGDDVPGMGALVGPFLSLEEEPDVLVLDRSDGGGVIAGYRPAEASTIEVSGTPGLTGGAATFRDLRLHDPATGEPAGPGSQAEEELAIDGVLVWTCASPPPFSDGWGPGTVRVRVEQPALELTWQASCWWALVDRGGQHQATLTAVDGDFMAAGGQEVAVNVTPLDEGEPFTLTAAAVRADESRSSTYTSGEEAPRFVERLENGSAGRLDFTGWRLVREFEADPVEPLGGPGGPLVIDGSLEWQCGEPRGPVVELEPTPPP